MMVDAHTVRIEMHETSEEWYMPEPSDIGKKEKIKIERTCSFRIITHKELGLLHFQSITYR